MLTKCSAWCRRCSRIRNTSWQPWKSGSRCGAIGTDPALFDRGQRQGLLMDIGRECREHYGPSTSCTSSVTADGAERILNWDCGRPSVIDEMLGDFELLVAPRDVFQPTGPYGDRVRALACGREFSPR